MTDPDPTPVTEAQIREAGRVVARVAANDPDHPALVELSNLATWLTGFAPIPGSPWPLRASIQPRVWLEGDEVPEETWFLTDEGSVEQDCTARTVDPDWSGPLVEVFVPDEAGYDAAVAAERTRRKTEGLTGDRP